MPFGVPVATTSVSATFNNNIDGLLHGTKWRDFSINAPITFSFTDSIADYENNYSDRVTHGASFLSLNGTQRSASRAWINQFAAVSNANFIELTGAGDRDATIRMASSDVPATAFAYSPNNAKVEGGDVWFNKVSYNNPVIGTYAYLTFGHELGHSLGLKHGHELSGVRNVGMNADRDSMEFSIMTYRSYVGGPITGGYTNETGGYAQSLMMYDIAAIQQMYGADYTTNANNTTYIFSTATGQMFVNGIGQNQPSANRVFRTIWDGNGVDTYNLSNYTTSLSIDLTPGGWVNLDRFGNFQRANLGGGTGGGMHPGHARGHIFNALQFGGDARSLIENAIGGTGNDVITGNSANNNLSGMAGNDTLNGNAGNDILEGGFGSDTLLGEAGNDSLYGGDDNDSLGGGDGDDYLDGGFGFDTIDGGNGFDTTSYAFYGGPIIANLSTGMVSFPGNSPLTDTLISIERLIATNGNDEITGSSVANTIDGGAGIDTLTGGLGSDTFVLSTRGASNYDIITDFSPSMDKIGLANALDNGLGGAITPGIQQLVFNGGNVTGNTLESGWFFKGAGFNGNGSELSGIFINTSTGDLWYNPTSTTAGDSQLIARINLSAMSTLTNSNFIYAA
jgi:serralysin